MRTGGWDGGAVPAVPLRLPVTMDFDKPQAHRRVLRARAAGRQQPHVPRVRAESATRVPRHTPRHTAPAAGRRSCSPTPTGSPRIDYVDGRSPAPASHDAARHRRRRVLARPPAATRRSRAGPRVHVRLNSPLEPRGSCARSTAGSSPTCTSPFWRPAGLAPGAYTLAVFAVDVYGAPTTRRRRAVDLHRRAARRRPAALTATATACPTRRTTARPSPTPTRPTATRTASATRATRSRPATCRPTPGETARRARRLRRGLREAPRATTLGFDGLRAPLQSASSCRSRASRRSRSARPWTPARARSRSTRRPTASPPPTAGPSASRPDPRRAVPASSRSARRAAKSASISTDVACCRPPGAEARCAGAPGARARSSARSRWSSRASTARSAARARRTARSATFITTDRCDGTLTEVGRGRSRCTVKKQKITVKAGHGLVPGQGQVVRGEEAAEALKVVALALLLAMAWAAPASAQFTPTVVPFVKGQQTPLDEGGATDQQRVRRCRVGDGGWDGGAVPAGRPAAIRT